MKALKITLILAVIFAMFTSCTKEDLNSDDVLLNPDELVDVSFSGGGEND